MNNSISELKKPAVFLDRDGTIIEDNGYLKLPEQVVFIPGVFSALRKLQKHFLLFIVTNQGGVGDGIISAADAAGVNNFILDKFCKNGIKITDVYVCPHSRKQGCSCIKPNPYFLLRAAEQYAIELSSSFTVGDHPHDVELAYQAGARDGIYVLTGHGQKHMHQLAPSACISVSIREAADLIVNSINKRVFDEL